MLRRSGLNIKETGNWIPLAEPSLRQPPVHKCYPLTVHVWWHSVMLTKRFGSHLTNGQLTVKHICKIDMIIGNYMFWSHWAIIRLMYKNC